MATIYYQRVTPLYRVTQVIWYVLYFIETVLAFRFVLRLLGANPAAGFTNFIYTISSPFYNPFANVIRGIHVSGSVIDWNILLAMVVYWIIAWAIISLFAMGRPVNYYEANRKLEDQDILQ